MAAGPVALRAPSPTYVTLPLPPNPKPSNLTAAPEWQPRSLHMAGRVRREMLQDSDQEVSDDKSEPPIDVGETALTPQGESFNEQAQPAEAQDKATQEAEPAEPTAGISDSNPIADETILQASLALLAHAMGFPAES